MQELTFIQKWCNSFQSIWGATKAGKRAVRSQLIQSPRCFDSDCSWDLFSCEEAVATAFIIYCKYNNSRKSGSAGKIKLCDKWFGFFPLTIMIWPELPQLRAWGVPLDSSLYMQEREVKGLVQSHEGSKQGFWHSTLPASLQRQGVHFSPKNPVLVDLGSTLKCGPFN